MENYNNLDILRHSTSHVLAQAIKRIYPDAKLAIGPAIKDGFYYDIDIDKKLTPDDFAEIEKEMHKIVSEKLPIIKSIKPKDEAIKFMQNLNETYKVELIENLSDDAEISFYIQGEFVDLCAGPHLENTKNIKAFKILSATGAYWKGDEKNKMLTRIYGTAFETQKELDDHIERLEEAKRRDHNKLGRSMELFTTVDYIGQGLPILMPKGAKMIQVLERFVEDEEEKRGYQITKTPLMAKSDLYKISGHWQHYKEGMFILGDEKNDKEVFALRPMTCPFQFQSYLARQRSYKELPIRYGETSTLFRNEASGEMHGLIRLRQFTISEGHIVCLPDQIESEFMGCLDLATFMLKKLGLFEDVSFRFSKWDEKNKDKYIGSAEEWNRTQDLMRQILLDAKLEYVEADGEAAFYGPKLDIQIKNVFGKEDTLITIQIDFQLAKKFEMEYVDADGQKKNPIILHRTSIGCYERTLALLIEKYAGKFPFWLAPEQIRIMPITERQIEFAKKIKLSLLNNGIRAVIDDSNEKFGAKIREFALSKSPYGVIIGDKELASNEVAVRSRDTSAQQTMSVEEFIKLAINENFEKNIELKF